MVIGISVINLPLNRDAPSAVMRGLDPRIPFWGRIAFPKRDGRDKPGHDGEGMAFAPRREARLWLILVRDTFSQAA
jgi:hypothetical protein